MTKEELVFFEQLLLGILAVATIILLALLSRRGLRKPARLPELRITTRHTFAIATALALIGIAIGSTYVPWKADRMKERYETAPSRINTLDLGYTWRWKPPTISDYDQRDRWSYSRRDTVQEYTANVRIDTEAMKANCLLLGLVGAALGALLSGAAILLLKKLHQ